MTIYLYGAYGAGNLGDDLILKSALQQYKEEECRVIAYGTPRLKEVADNYIGFNEFISSPASYFSAGDVLIFAGGGLFWAGIHVEQMARAALAAADAGCDVRIERIGAHGFHVSIEAVRQLCAIASFVSVRDRNSVDLFRRYQVTDKAVYEPDFVLALEGVPERRMAAKPAIALNHSASPFFHEEEHRSKTLRIYGELSARFAGAVDFYYVPHVRHFSVIDQNDVIYGEYFWNASKGRIQPIPFPASVEALLEHYAGMNGAIGWRYHLQVLATLFGIPSAYLGQLDEHKYLAFAKEHDLPIIDLDAPEDEVISSAAQFIGKVLQLSM